MNNGFKKMKVASAAFIAIAMVFASCGGKEKKQILIDGSSTVYPITEAVAEEYRMVEDSVNVTVGTSGSGGGFKKFCNHETDISDASRPIKKSELDVCAEAGINAIELPISYDGVAIVINPDNDFAGTLTVEQLRKAFDNNNPAKTWKDVNPAWPDGEIKVFSPGHDSGTYDYFNEVIIGKTKNKDGKKVKGQVRTDATFSEDDNTLVMGVAGEKYAIGFFGLAYFEENKDKLQLVAVVNSKGQAIQPTLDTVKDGSYEPLSRPLFIYVKDTAADQPHVKKFVEYYLDTANSLLEDVGYIPLPDRVVEMTKNRFAKKITGSVYQTAGAGDKSLEELYK